MVAARLVVGFLPFCIPFSKADIWDDISNSISSIVSTVSDTATDFYNDADDLGDDISNWFADGADTVDDYSDQLDLYYDIIDSLSDEGYHDSGGADFFMSTSTASSADSGSFTVLTYNMKGFPDALDGISDAATVEVGELIETWNTDIVAIQEDWVKHDLLLSGITTANFPYRTRHYDGASTTLGDGLATLSKFPFDKTWAKRKKWQTCIGTLWEFIMGAVNSPDCISKKGFTMVRMVIDNDFELDFYNLHGETQWDYNTMSANMAQLAAFINEKSAGRAILIAGDWNSSVEDDGTESQQAKKNVSLWIQELIDSTGVSFACVDIEHDPLKDYSTVEKQTVYKPCDVDVIAYRGSNMIKLTPVSRMEVEDNNISDHDPVKVIFEWERETTWSAVTTSNTAEVSLSLFGLRFDKFVRAKEGGGSGVVADRTAIGSHEVFTLAAISPSIPDCIQDGDYVSIKTANGKYFSADNNERLDGKGTYVGSWETFKLKNKSHSSGCLQDRDEISFSDKKTQYFTTHQDDSMDMDNGNSNEVRTSFYAIFQE
jgi:endonuclease/exonuclease/phosphatase family metal-dependent hydrolase